MKERFFGDIPLHHLVIRDLDNNLLIIPKEKVLNTTL